MKTIPLTQGKVALVDDEDYEWLNQWKWCADKQSNTFYAVRLSNKNGKRIKIRMHIEILGKKYGYIIDHKDGNGLNNIRDNIRHITQRQNTQNRHKVETSKYPGVYWHKQSKKWNARIRIGKERKSLGLYVNEIDAFNVYKKAVKNLINEDVIGW